MNKSQEVVVPTNRDLADIFGRIHFDVVKFHLDVTFHGSQISGFPDFWILYKSLALRVSLMQRRWTLEPLWFKHSMYNLDAHNISYTRSHVFTTLQRSILSVNMITCCLV